MASPGAPQAPGTYMEVDMAAKKKAAEAAEPSKAAPTDARVVAGAEIDDETAQRLAAQRALIVERESVKADPKGDIDERMAALLKDHQAMGARPKG